MVGAAIPSHDSVAFNIDPKDEGGVLPVNVIEQHIHRADIAPKLSFNSRK